MFEADEDLHDLAAFHLRRQGAPLWEPAVFYREAARFLRGEPLGPCGAGRLYLDLRADGSVAPCLDLPPVATPEDLAAGRAGPALEAAQQEVAAETGRVLVGARLRALARRGGAR